MNRREFLQVLAAAAASGLALDSRSALSAGTGSNLYSLPKFGNVSLLHFTDCHAQLMPLYYREPSVNLGVGGSFGKTPHLVGDRLLRNYGIKPDTPEAYAFSHLDFEKAARAYGKVGGFAHLATLVKTLRAQRPGAILLDGGDTWQGSALSLWTKGQDMVEACKLLGVNVMTGHWEFTYGAGRVKQVVDNDFRNKISFVAQNVVNKDFGDPVFLPYTLRTVNNVTVGIIGQAYPHTPAVHPRHFVPNWTFGIQAERLQKTVDHIRRNGIPIVVLLSHSGMDADLKLASQVVGIDAILGGHSHDAVAMPVVVKNPGGQTIVTNAGSNGKFLAVLDLNVKNDAVADYRYKLLPVFSNLLEPDPEMAALIARHREPFEARLNEPLAVTEGMLYRRGNFNGTFDQLILDALMEVKGAEVALSPGFRWGTTLLPGDRITMERLMEHTAITYPQTTVTDMTGAAIKSLLEDAADNLFNPDPFKQQGDDMVRVGGIEYTCAPGEKMGNRISGLTLKGNPLVPNKTYKVASWAPLAEGASGEPVWEVVATWLRDKKTVPPRKLNTPKLPGMQINPGLA